MKKPKVFIGSSTKGKKYAQTIQLLLSHVCEVTIWSQGVFGLSSGYLEELVKALDKYDFAILVLTPDDMLLSRDDKTQSPRDNVIFEIGLFIGRIGRKRTFIVRNRNGEIKIPSDLAGISMAEFEINSDNNLQSSFGPCCTLIQTEIEKQGAIHRPLPSETKRIDKFKNDYYTTFLGKLIDDFSVIDSIESPLFKEYIKIDCDDFASSADMWKKSKLMIPQVNYDGFLIDAYENAESSVFSTSIKEYLSIWDEPFGERLMDAHKKSKAHVIRVFVFDTRVDITDEFVQLMKFQKEAGIEVKIFIDNEYPAFNFPADLSKDFTVIDKGRIIGKTVTFGRSRNAEWLFKNKLESNKFQRYMDRLTKGSIEISELKQ